MNWTSRLARARAELEQLFMLIVFCNLIGHSIPAPLLLHATLTLNPAGRAALEARGGKLWQDRRRV